MRRQIVVAFLVALVFSILVPKVVEAGWYNQCTPDERGRCSLAYEIYEFGSCYGNGFLCYKTWW